MSDSEKPSREVVERDIDFDAVLRLVRLSSPRDAADLLHAALQIAFNNGECVGFDRMSKIADSVLERTGVPKAEGAP